MYRNESATSVGLPPPSSRGGRRVTRAVNVASSFLFRFSDAGLGSDSGPCPCPGPPPWLQTPSTSSLLPAPPLYAKLASCLAWTSPRTALRGRRDRRRRDGRAGRPRERRRRAECGGCPRRSDERRNGRGPSPLSRLGVVWRARARSSCARACRGRTGSFASPAGPRRARGKVRGLRERRHDRADPRGGNVTANASGGSRCRPRDRRPLFAARACFVGSRPGGSGARRRRGGHCPCSSGRSRTARAPRREAHPPRPRRHHRMSKTRPSQTGACRAWEPCVPAF